MLARGGPRAYLALLLALSLVACFLPLADHLGYELSELVALAAGLFGAAPGVAAARASPDAPARALLRALGFALLALALPVAMLLLNGLRRPACDPLGGLWLYALLALPSAVLAAMLGVACGLLAPRRAGLLVALVFVASLAAALLPLLHGPQVFAFHHLGGMYPGPIYDEDIRPSAALYWFRLDTLLYAAACAGAALLVKGRRRGLLLLLAAGAPAVLLSFQAEKLHWKASLAQVDAELGGRLETEHLVLHFPREKPEPEQRLLALDAEASVRGVSQFLGAPPGARISVFLYRSADEKRRLVGAADTSFTKPWLRQIHTNDAPAPHPILRHELVHALAADLARGPFGVPGRLFGLLPEMALIEGLAVAGDWPPGEFTAHEETRALRELKLMPEITRLFAPGLFYAESGARAYTSAGSFVRFLWETRGPAWLRDVYAGRAQLGPLAPLALEYEKFLDGQRAPERAVALASLRFSAKAIVRQRCAHEVAGLQREAGLAGLRGDAAGAVSLWARGCALEPDDPGLLLQLRRAQASAHQDEAARATLAQLLAHPKLSRPLRAQALTEAGDGAWKAGDAEEAAARFEEAAQLPQAEAGARALAVRLEALRDPKSWPALRPLLVDGNTGAEVILALRDLDLARPRDGLAAYLLARQLQARGAWAECARETSSALSRTLPGPLFLQEALRLRGVAAWHLGDLATARTAFSALGKDAPPGRALEAQRWLERLQ